VIDLGDLVVVEVPDRRGWVLNMILLRLPSGGLLVHSPTCGDGVFEQVESVGRPEFLFAPNHFHHMSLERFRQQYPEAKAICSDAARPRLTKKNHPGLGGLDLVKLPLGARFIDLPQVKNGEAWLSLPGEGGPTWIVCDGFMHMHKPLPLLLGWVLRLLDVYPGLKIARTFKWLTRDKRAYRAWLLDLLRAEQPRRVIFSHGEPLTEHATERLIEVAEKALPG
jgi:hypothetical protein